METFKFKINKKASPWVMLIDEATLSELLNMRPEALDLGFNYIAKIYRSHVQAGIQVYPAQWSKINERINGGDQTLSPYDDLMKYLKKYTSMDGCYLQEIFNACEGLVSRLSSSHAVGPLINRTLDVPYSLKKIKGPGVGNILIFKPLYMEALKKAHPYTVSIFLKACLVQSGGAVLNYSQREELVAGGAQNHIEAWDPSLYRVTTLMNDSVRGKGPVNFDLENKIISWTELLNITEQFNHAFLPMPSSSPRKKFSLMAS